MPYTYIKGKGNSKKVSYLGRNLYNKQIYNFSTLRLEDRGVPNIHRYPIRVSPLIYPFLFYTVELLDLYNNL